MTDFIKISFFLVFLKDGTLGLGSPYCGIGRVAFSSGSYNLVIHGRTCSWVLFLTKKSVQTTPCDSRLSCWDSASSTIIPLEPDLATGAGDWRMHTIHQFWNIRELEPQGILGVSERVNWFVSLLLTMNSAKGIYMYRLDWVLSLLHRGILTWGLYCLGIPGSECLIFSKWQGAGLRLQIWRIW